MARIKGFQIDLSSGDTYIDITGINSGDSNAITMALGVSGLGAFVGSPMGAGSHTIFSATDLSVNITATDNNNLGSPIISSSSGGNLNLSAGNGSGAGIGGGELIIRAGSGYTVGGRVAAYGGLGQNGPGGAVEITGGQGANVSGGNGGAVTIAGGLAPHAYGYGGAINITSGVSGIGQPAADVTITAANGVAGYGQYGGSVAINAGSGDFGGSINIYAGAANTGFDENEGGIVQIRGGDSDFGNAGQINILAGSATYAGGGYNAGNVEINAGSGSVDNDGGDIFLQAGTSGAGLCGDIWIRPGGSATATDGSIKLFPHDSATSAIELRFHEASPQTNYIALKAPDAFAGNQVFILPAADGTAGQALVTSGGGEGEFSFDTVVKPDSNGLLPIQLSKISTGLFTGGALSFGTLSGSPATTTLFSVAAGTGIVVNNYTDPGNPTYSLVSWSVFTDITITNLATEQRTFVAIDVAGSPNPTIIQQATAFTPTQHRDYVVLGTIGHANHVNVVAIRNNPLPAFDATVRLGDLGHALGAFNMTGNVYSADGVNLNLDKTLGESYRVGNNFHTNKASPDITTDSAESALEWNYSYQDGSGGFTLTGKTSTIVPNNWDDGDGGLNTVGTQSWSIQIIKHFPGGAGHRIEYGQVIYGTDTEALANIPDPTHIHNPAFADGIIRAYLIVRGGATDLSDTADAYFIEAAKFAGVGGITTASFPGITDLSTGTVLTLTNTESTFTNRIDATLITEKNVTSSPTTTYTADLTTASVFSLTLGGDTAITFSNVPGSGSPLIPSLSTTVTFLLTQDAVGSPELGTRTPSFPASVKWESGTVPTWTTVAGATDVVTMFTVDNGTTWYANLIGQGYA